MRMLKHIFFLFVLAALCYVLAITIATDQIAFIIFFVIGIIFEIAFWILFWAELRASRRRRVA